MLLFCSEQKGPGELKINVKEICIKALDCTSLATVIMCQPEYSSVYLATKVYILNQCNPLWFNIRSPKLRLYLQTPDLQERKV